ncbi:MAG: alpha/beta hydrolase [Polyangia bacterium]
MGRRLDLALGVLNGAIGQHLSRTENELGTTMAAHRGGASITVAELVAPTPHLVVLVHGIMGTEHVWAFPDGSDYGTALESLGMTPLRLRYNSGRAVADNGASLSKLLDEIVATYPVPVESITLVGHSMGGLVIRSALHQPSTWRGLVRRAIYLGTPHRGAPLERVGKVVHRVLSILDQPYTRLVADVADLRSDGMKDLGDVHPHPLAPHVKHHVVAGTLFEAKLLAELLGDALVPLSSATDGVEAPFIVHAGHNALAHHPDVREQLVAWCRQ